MKYAIISDIHSNLEAFRAVIGAIKKEKVDKYLFVGDIVGYGADPCECIADFKKLKCTAVVGNHDWGAVDLTSIEGFNSYAQEAIKWTIDQLSEKDKEFLKSFPLVKKIDDITLVHSTLENPEKWHYIYSTFQAHKSIELQETKILFVGHSHMPITFLEPSGTKGPIRFVKEETVQIQKDYKYLINVGSVGQPRDGNPRACYCIYDKETQTIDIKRVEYDIKKAQEKIIEAGLPERLAQRLENGE
ncbi:MAG: metallophosphoesterase family protein [Candidatus Ratteibacteria bacterium]|nr:metallophosphoesterase family protein [Candidatus Ratteibacteria bacterium]